MPIVIDTTTNVGTIYATVDEARARGVTTSQVATDADLTTWLEAASREVDDYTHRRFKVTPSTVTVTTPRSSLVILPYPFSAITTVTDNGVAQTLTTHYTIEKYGLRFDYRPRGPVVVAGIFGHPDVPSPVRDATVLLVQANLEDGTYRPSVGTDIEGNPTSLPLVGTVPFTSRTKRAVARAKLDPYRNEEGVA